MMDKTSLKRFLKNHNIHLNKEAGQHFLIDEDILDSILDAASLPPEHSCIEVGAGIGILTKAVARDRNTKANHASVKPGTIHAIEKDTRFSPILHKQTRDYPFVNIHTGDILSFYPTDLLLDNAPYHVIGNIPYSISARLLRHVLSWRPAPKHIIFLIDEEVGKRIMAKPPATNLLAVSVQAFADVACTRSTIPPNAFFPPPKVHSAIIKITPLDPPRIPREKEQAVFRLIRSGFSQRRKTLHNALRPLWHITAQDAFQKLQKVGIDPMRRAQTLSIEEWLHLAETLDIPK